jgi:dihydrofolate synthase/folylpolyglutamate synthase
MFSERMHEVENELLARWPETRIDPSLDRISALTDILGSPQLSYPTIHIAGTNGKTTTTRLIDSLLFELGLRTGRFTSPHLQSILERVAINGSPISEGLFINAYEDIYPYLGMIDEKMPHPISFFEAITALSFVAFAEYPVDVGIYECGMGGEWDSTNVIESKVSVVTPIGFDHMEYLGDTLEKIAQTKSGIIKENTFAVLAKQEREAAQVLIDRCLDTNSTPIREGVEFEVLKRSVAVGGQLISIRGVYGIYEDLFLPIHGRHQASNAATALATVEVFVGEHALDNELVKSAFAGATSPGRFEVVHRNPTVIIDAAHNPHGAKSLKETINSEFNFDLVIGLVAAMGDKDISGLLEELEPVMSKIIVTRNSSKRSATLDEIDTLARKIFGSDRVIAIDSLVEAINQGLSLAKDTIAIQDKSCALLITGSVVTAGEARTFLAKEDEPRS